MILGQGLKKGEAKKLASWWNANTNRRFFLERDYNHYGPRLKLRYLVKEG